MWTRRRIRIFAFTFIAVMTATALAMRLTAVNGLDRCGNALFPDFAQVYVAGWHVLQHRGDTLYRPAAFHEEVNGVLNDTDAAGFYPVYPPLTAVLGSPWALMPYPAAAWTHALFSILAAWILARDMGRRFFGDSDDASIATILFLAFLPLWRVWLFGQNSIWALAILWGAWRLWASNAGFRAGLLLSLGLFKPQLFVGAWLWALLWGNHRLRAGLALGLVAGLGVGMAGVGPASWTEWLGVVRHTTTFAERIGWMTSLPHAWRLVGGESLLGTAWIYAAMGVGVVVWLAALLRMRLRGKSPEVALCLALLGSWLLTPRLYVYDWILAWPLMLAAWKYGTPNMRQALAWAGLVFWVHDFLGMLHIPILTLFGVAAFVWLLRRQGEVQEMGATETM